MFRDFEEEAMGGEKQIFVDVAMVIKTMLLNPGRFILFARWISSGRLSRNSYPGDLEAMNLIRPRRKLLQKWNQVTKWPRKISNTIFDPSWPGQRPLFIIFEKVIKIKNFLKLIIKHYPNYMRIIDQLRVVVETIEREVNDIQLNRSWFIGVKRWLRRSQWLNVMSNWLFLDSNKYRHPKL